ncbi:hypothetical protein QNI19_38865, partial [Cytophagaceae bacterium DM2B3-1]
MTSFLLLLLKSSKKFVGFLEKKLQVNKPATRFLIKTLAPKVLTDSKDINGIKPYLDNLKQAIDEKGINNIALTGSYGSGKSTILNTFRSLHPEPTYRYLNISLASFKDNKELPDKTTDTNTSKNNKENNDDEGFQRKLEISILQQIFYHVEPSVIPDSRFKRIINTSKREFFIQTSSLILWIVSALILFEFKKIDKLNPDNWSLKYTIDWYAIGSIVFFFWGIGFFSGNIIRLFRNSKINKLTIKGELEIGEASDKSVFNQHLEEILYFFERTDFNVVIIEDLDRFNNTEIFTKLREINILINNSKLIHRSVKFVYAIKDDMFTDKNDRVKFFEFIIPVIPFINPSNANEQLLKLLGEANLEGVLSPDFTSDVVTFIDDIDMRLLINIFQEFLVYRANLSKNLNQDKLFAIIVYKNMFPDDFGKLARRGGNLYKFLSSKPLYIKELIDAINSKIETINQRIDLLEQEVEKPIRELRAVYINQLVSKLDRFYKFSIDNAPMSVVEVLDDQNFDKIKQSDNIKFFQYDYYNSPILKNSGKNIVSIGNEISNLTYQQREQLLLDKFNNQINKLKLEKENLRNKISELEGLSIEEIFEQVNIENHLGPFKDNYLMRNLLLNGYIDEHYDIYISIFHAVSLTQEDFEFERQVKARVSPDFDYSLTYIKNLIRRLPEHYFKHSSILNYTLFEFLLEHKTSYEAKYINFIKQLSADEKKQFDFVLGMIKRNTKNIDLFIKDLSAYKPTFWEYLENKSGLPDEEIRSIVRLIFEFAEIDSIIKFNQVETLANYFVQMEDFFAFTFPFKKIETLQAFLIQKQVLFEKLDKPVGTYKDLDDYIYQNNLYKINEHNIYIFINHYKEDTNPEDLKSSHYSTILNSDLSELQSYISENIEEYIENVMLKIPTNTLEYEDTLIEVLNNEDVDPNLKFELVQSQSTIITLIREINDNVEREMLLITNKVEPTWSNVLDYFYNIESEDFDKSLIDFLNRKENYTELSKTELNISTEEEDEEYFEKVSSTILYCKELTLEAFSSLLNSIDETYDNLTYEDLTTERLEVMLSKKKLILSEDNLKGLKEKGRNLHIKLIEIYQNDFIKEYKNYSLQPPDWTLFFKSPNIEIGNKLVIMKDKEFDDSIIVANPQLANAICETLPTDEYIPLNMQEKSEQKYKFRSNCQKHPIAHSFFGKPLRQCVGTCQKKN